ncbi:DUF3471 domain-containing protein [Algoriphagus formosus]|uniref:DUF3471 domain-containing protein n=1 Tax=Algoriphagus formosus TaxID=2007308 RepID=UPI000C289561|nr:DUF3471 domain-containing protein [Algoriphagus formosus]
MEKIKLLGTYLHPMYGEAVVQLENERLIVRFNQYLSFELVHWFGDTFLGKTQEKFLGWDEYFEFKPDRLEVFGASFFKRNP